MTKPLMEQDKEREIAVKEKQSSPQGLIKEESRKFESPVSAEGEGAAEKKQTKLSSRDKARMAAGGLEAMSVGVPRELQLKHQPAPLCFPTVSRSES